VNRKDAKGVQSAILLVLGLLLGARYKGGWGRVTALVICPILVAVPIGALSSALALAVRKEESVIGASNFILLPLTFLSPVFMASALMPGWMRIVARFNPVNWSVEAAREALQSIDELEPGAVTLRISDRSRDRKHVDRHPRVS
jgi:ABC-2 type transport system permease protein